MVSSHSKLDYLSPDSAYIPYVGYRTCGNPVENLLKSCECPFLVHAYNADPNDIYGLNPLLGSERFLLKSRKDCAYCVASTQAEGLSDFKGALDRQPHLSLPQKVTLPCADTSFPPRSRLSRSGSSTHILKFFPFRVEWFWRRWWSCRS